MQNVKLEKITIEEFKKDIYKRYIKLFPEEEQRDFKKIEQTYDQGIESFYKITLNNETVVFFMMERLNESVPYYMDYFAIYDEYQDKNLGSKALKELLRTVILDNGLIGEIEKVTSDNPTTVRRLKFYERLGFKKLDSEYLIYGVSYNPLIYPSSNENIDYDEILFKYYQINVGKSWLQKHFKIIKKEQN